MRILVIEDNSDIAANLGDYLEERGHTVDFAADGVTGLHLAVVHEFDAIVLDLNLPGMDGLEVCRKLRNEARKQTPVLMLTARDSLDNKLAGFEHEVFAVLFLDTRHRLIEYREMFHGTIDSASVYPREVVKEALRLNAAAVILSHNHPSGSPEPSQADKVLTQRLKEALGLVEVRILDHVIVGGMETVSFAEKGLA